MQAPGVPLSKEAAEKTARSIFVGNIPYEATEEKLVELFSKVLTIVKVFVQTGPVISFRLVYDRESGKPKGYGFCEYSNAAIAASALRNLQNIEFNGRPLRIGPAAGEQNSAELALSNPTVGPPLESPYGDPVDSQTAPEAISRAVASLPPEQMYELMMQMKLCIQNNPNEARNMLLQNPQLAYALLQAQIVMKIVDPKVAIAMLNRSHDQIPPAMPDSSGIDTSRQPISSAPAAPIPATPQPPSLPQQQPPIVTSMPNAPTYMIQQPGPPQCIAPQSQPQIPFPTYTGGRPSQPPHPQQHSFPGPPGPSAQPNSHTMLPRQPLPPGTRPPLTINNQMGAQISPAMAAAAAASMGSNSLLAGQAEQDKITLIMQVLQLSEEQIAMLPDDQRRSIRILKEQVGKAGAI